MQALKLGKSIMLLRSLVVHNHVDVAVFTLVTEECTCRSIPTGNLSPCGSDQQNYIQVTLSTHLV